MNLKNVVATKSCAAILALLIGGDLSAQSIALDNASFEDPVIPPFDISLIDPELFNPGNELALRFAIGLQLTETSIPSWVQTGDVFIDNHGVLSDTGIFSNQDVPALGVTGITGIDGDQLGFLIVNPLADGVTEDFVSIYQETDAVFTSGEDYRFSLEVGNAVTFPATERTPLQIVIGYLDDSSGQTGSEVFQPIKSKDILVSQLDNSGSGQLTDFDLDLLASEINPSDLGKQIAVQVIVAIPDDLTQQEIGNIGGGFNIDNARLVVPEPGSMALLGIGGLVLLRRRRRA